MKFFWEFSRKQNRYLKNKIQNPQSKAVAYRLNQFFGDANKQGKKILEKDNPNAHREGEIDREKAKKILLTRHLPLNLKIFISLAAKSNPDKKIVRRTVQIRKNQALPLIRTNQTSLQITKNMRKVGNGKI